MARAPLTGAPRNAASAGRSRGFGLPDVLTATLLLSLAAAGVATLIATSIEAGLDAGLRTSSALLAAQKLEQLRSHHARALEPSPAGTLEASVAGFADRLDARGEPVQDALDGGTVFVRRWSVSRPPHGSDLERVIQVRVIPFRRMGSARSSPPGSLRGEVWLVAIVRPEPS